MRGLLVAGLLWGASCGGGADAPAAGGAGSPAATAATTSAGKRVDLSMDDFIARHPEGLQIVDVRTDGEYAGGHIPGTVHVPVDQLAANHPALQSLDKTKPVYFVCAVGGRSAKAADQMAAAGFHAINVLGGTNAWVDQGQALQKP
jgi:rhodanese-related sulfurtransferase